MAKVPSTYCVITSPPPPPVCISAIVVAKSCGLIGSDVPVFSLIASAIPVKNSVNCAFGPIVVEPPDEPESPPVSPLSPESPPGVELAINVPLFLNQ